MRLVSGWAARLASRWLPQAARARAAQSPPLETRGHGRSPPRRSPGASPRKRSSTATGASTTTAGSAARTPPRCWPTCGPRTPTPRPSCGRPSPCRTPFTARCWPGSSRPTSRSRSGSGAGSTTRAPRRASSTPSAPGSGARRPRPSRCCSTPTRSPGPRSSWGSAPSRSRSTAGGSPTPWIRPAFASTPSSSRTSAPARCSPTGWPGSTSVQWADDGRTLFYVTEDAQTKRPHRLWRHTLGSDSEQGRARLRGDRRALRAGRLAHPQRPVPAGLLAQPHHQRGPLSARPNSPRGELRLIAPRIAGPGVRGRPPRRPVLHPHQRPGPELPPRHRPHAPHRTVTAGAS